MKKILLLALLLCSLFSKSQRYEWASAAATTGGEYGNDIAVMSNGSAYIVGTFSTTIAFGTTTLTPKGASDAFVAKIDPTGAYLWVKQIAGTSIDVGNTVTFDASGNVYVAGSFQGKLFYTSTDSSVSSGGYDAFLAKYDPSGTFLWRTSAAGYNGTNDYGKAVAVSPVKNIVYLALEQDNNTHAFVKSYTQSSGALSSLASIDAATVTVNDVSVQNTSPTDDYVFIGGGYAGNMYHNGGTTVYHSPVGSTDSYVAKLYFQNGSTGVSMSLSDGGSGADACTGVWVMPSGNYYYSGKATGTFTVGGQAMVNSGQDIFVAKYISNNSFQWAKQGKTNGGNPTGMYLDSQENIYLSGYSPAGGFKSGTVTGMPAAGAMVVKLYSNGYIASRVSVGSSSSSTSANAIGLDGQGNAYVVGNLNVSGNFSVTTLTSAGASDIFYGKINYTSISTPSLGTVKCTSTKDGDYLSVNFKVSKKLVSTNTFSLQVDTTSGGDFVTPINLATVATDTSGTVSNYLPRGKYAYAHFRVTASNPAYIGDQSVLYISPKLVAAVTPTSITRCSNDPSTVSTFTASGSDNFGNTYTFSPSSGITVNSDPVYYATPGVTTIYTMTANNFNGCKDTVAFRVTVNPAPTMTLVSNPIYTCPGTTVALTNTVSANVTSYTWAPASTLSSTNAAIPVASPTANTLYSYTIATAQNCKLASNVSVSLYSAPVPNAGLPSYTTCLRSTVPLSGTAGGGITYTWSPATGIAAPNSLTTSATPSTTTTYTLMVTNVNGCNGQDVIAINVGNVTVDAGASQTITCNNNASLTATPTGTFVSPYTYNWTPTVALTSYTNQATVANPHTTKWYYVTMTTANGCSATDSVKVTVNEPNYSASFSVTPSQVINLPSPAQFNNNTPSPSNYTFYWYFGDGTNIQSNNPSVFHLYQYNGTYDVTLVATSNASGCADTMRIPGYVYVTGGSSCSATASVTAPNGLSGCAGDSVKLMANTGTGLSYQWMLNGVNLSAATSSTYYAKSVGNYAVSVSNGSCAAVSIANYVSFNGLPATPVIAPSGSLDACSGGSEFLQAGAGYASYLWSTGATTQNITITQTGVYTVTVTNTAGCKASDSYSAGVSYMAAPDICIVGIDSLASHCIVIWDKPASLAIDSFIVYREGSSTGQFNRLGAQEYGAFSTYVDTSSNAQVQSYSYRLSLKDTCGFESMMSAHHKTIHLTMNSGMGGAWNLIWSDYEGIAFSTYNIYRGTDPDSLSLFTAIAGNNHSYSDLTPPGGSAVYYQVEILSPGSCNPTAKTVAGYSRSRSNIASSVPTGIAGYNDLLDHIQVMPNPFNEVLVVNIGKINSKNHTITISDVLGKTLVSRTDSDPNQVFHLPGLDAGIYYITITDGAGNRFTKKLIKS